MSGAEVEAPEWFLKLQDLEIILPFSDGPTPLRENWYAGDTRIWIGADQEDDYPLPGWTPAGQALLEYALREECMARGWNISMDIRPGTQPQRHCAVLYTPQFCSAHADTPAHALALALLSALS